MWVDGRGPIPSRLMIVGEAPGGEEVKQGKCFVGPTGKELDNLLHRIIGLWIDEVYCTNLGKTPWENNKKIMTPEELEVMGIVLRDEIEEVNPDVILTLGAVSTYWFLGDEYDMETLNALPHRWEGRIVVPSFHPAAAFRDTSLMSWVIEAFEKVKDLLSGDLWYQSHEAWVESEKTKIISLPERGRHQWAIDTETKRDGSPFMVTASNTEGRASHVTVDEGKKLMGLKQLVEQSESPVILHNALFDLPILWECDIHPKSWIDTMHIAFLLQTLPLGLKNLAYKLCGMRIKEYDDIIGDANDLSELPKNISVPYACAHADATLRVYNRMRPLWYEGMEGILQRDMEIMPSIIEMMKNGMKIDPSHFEDLNCEFTVKNVDLLEKIEEYGGEGFNPASAPQVAKLLYKKLKLGRHAKIKKTKWGGSTDSKSMKKIKDEHPVVGMIEEWRQRDTLIDKFINILPEKVDNDGRIHTKISMVRVKHSGRLASSNPNLMAQPIRTEEGLMIRDGFIAMPGYKFVEFDYNQIEMRLMAHLSQDSVMLEVYKNNGDIHTDTAMRMFKIKNPKDVNEIKHRYPAKRIGFGVINLITAHGLSRELAEGGAGIWPEDECQEYLDMWFVIHGGVKEYFNHVERKAFREGKVMDVWGRMELIPEVKSVFRHIRETGIRKAVNQGIQSGAQGIIKEAMRRIGEQWEILRKYARWIIQIHDSLLFEVKEKKVEGFICVITGIMERAVELSIPIRVEAKVGDRWGSMRKFI